MDNINDIIASLTPDDIKSLKETAEAIFGTDNNFSKQQNKQTEHNNFSSYNSDFTSFLNPEMFSKIAGVMNAMNSDGGKKSTYYSATKKTSEVFRDLFFQEISENPTIFYNQFAVRILTLSMLTKDDQLEFLNNVKQRIVLHKAEIENLLNNPYEEYDNYQKVFLTSALNNIPLMLEMIESLKND